MMIFGSRPGRLVGGLLLVIALIAATFALMLPLSQRWGASAAEAGMALPGDDALTAPQAGWTNAISINAPPEQVWPWIAQMGDTRGGFYSFTFIEDRVGSLMGDASYAVDYTNANTIVPAWQDPQPGESMISGILKIAAAQPGEWLLADSVIPEVFGWTWVWQIQPTRDGQATRLVNRTRIQAAGPDNPVMNVMMGLGGFIMNQRTMQGIKARAEGWVEPGYRELAEIVLWCATLLTGLIAAALFVIRSRWRAPLAVALAAFVVLMLLTFLQPAVWLRVILLVALLGVLILTWRSAAPGAAKASARASGRA